VQVPPAPSSNGVTLGAPPPAVANDAPAHDNRNGEKHPEKEKKEKAPDPVQVPDNQASDSKEQ
jgi:hypothetical protein